jgi:2-polyprenyl-3-methyl-5-hydroxy-6-metoxy-1,4-benzoquinol methylase
VITGKVGQTDGHCEICAGQLHTWQLDRRNAVNRCTDCGHVSRDIASAPAGARSPAYGGDASLDRWRLAVTYRRLVRRLQPRGARVFEVGFGSGALLRRFLDDGAIVAGADPGALAVAVDPVVSAHATLHTTSLEIPPRQDPADLVIAVHVVEHVADPAQFARTCYDLIRPGGQLVLVTPAGDSVSLRLFRSRWWMLEDPTHVRFFSARSIIRLLSDAGFVDVRAKRLVLDSLSVEAASCMRVLRWRHLPPDGVLASPATRALALLSAPVVILVRLLRTTTRPAMEIAARRPERSA